MTNALCQRWRHGRGAWRHPADGAERTLVGYGARHRPAGVPAGVWLRQALADVGAVRVRHPGCWRYAWPLGGPAARRRICIAPARTGYPKPDGGIVDQLDLLAAS